MESKKLTLEEVQNALMDFVKRASEKNATPEEIAALPKVAQVLVDSFVN